MSTDTIDTKALRERLNRTGCFDVVIAKAELETILDAADRLAELEAENARLQAELARVREIVSGMREYADSCDHPSEASKRNAVEYWLTKLEDALSPAPEPILSTCPVCGDPDDHEHDSMAAPAPELPLMARDTCTNCGGTGVGGYHVHAPQEDAVEALRCEACDGFGFIEHGPKDCPATAPELPLMARREWMGDGTDYFVVHGEFCLEVESFRGKAPHYEADGLLIVIGDSAVCDQVDAEAQPDGIYRIADTDEHGLPVVERTADMPKRAKYRLSWITQADAAGGEVEYTDSLPLALEANRSGAVSERIEDYRESGKEGKE